MKRLLIGILAALALVVPAVGNAGTQINLTDEEWICNQELSNYGTLPIEVTIDYTTSNSDQFGVRLNAGCDGDEDTNTIDLIVHINGNGINGPYDDAIRIANTTAVGDIVISGDADCGQARADDPDTPGDQSAHQDGVHAIGGHDITLRNLYVGLNGPDGNPSCQGAAGALFYSGDEGDRAPSNMDVEGGEYRACNNGYQDGAGQSPLPTGDVSNAVIRSGYDSGHPDACENSAGTKFNNGGSQCNTSNTSVTETDIVCDAWPYVGVSSLATNTSLGSGTTLTLTVPVGGVSLGNTLVVAAVHNSGSTGITASDSDGNIYTADEERVQNASNLAAYILSAPITNALESGDTITVTFPATSTRRAAEAIRVEGLLSPGYTGPQASQGQTTVTALSSGATAMTTTSHAVVIGAFGWNNTNDGADTFTAGTGFTPLSTTTADNRQLFTEYDEVSATGTYTATATASAAGNSASLVAVYYG